MPAEDASFVQMVGEMHRLFGTRRMMELLGYGVVIGATLRPGDGPAEVRERLMKMGISRSSSYRTTADLRDLGRSLEVLRKETIAMSDVLEELGSVQPSLLRDFVVK